MAASDDWKAILTVIEGDLLAAEGGPLITFLTAFGAAAGDPVKIAAAWVGLQGSFVASLPQLEATLSQQIATALTAKLQAAIGKIGK